MLLFVFVFVTGINSFLIFHFFFWFCGRTFTALWHIYEGVWSVVVGLKSKLVENGESRYLLCENMYVNVCRYVFECRFER